MPFLASNEAVAMIGFRFELTAAIGLLVSAAVIIAFARDCFGRSRAAMAAAVLLFAVDVALAGAVEPIEFVAVWQLQWFFAWSLSLFFADDEVQAWLGRLLMAGGLFDAVLIAGAVVLTNRGFPDGALEPKTLLIWGCALSLAARIAALPVGAHAVWNERPLRPTVAWILLACLPPATILVMRLIEQLTIDPTPHLGISQFLVVTAIAAGLTSLRQEFAIRETAWRISAGLAGVAAVSVLSPPWLGRFAWLVAAAVCVIVGRRLPHAIIPHRYVAPSNDFIGRLEASAAREWNLPRAWRFAVVLPMRGASQVLRFVDGFLFEQIPTQAIRKLDTATAPVRRAIPELFSRLLIASILVAAFIVLLALAFR